MTAGTVVVWMGVMVIGGLGSTLRFLVDRTIARRMARTFPFGIFAVTSAAQHYSDSLPAWHCPGTRPCWRAPRLWAPTPPSPLECWKPNG